MANQFAEKKEVRPRMIGAASLNFRGSGYDGVGLDANANIACKERHLPSDLSDGEWALLEPFLPRLVMLAVQGNGHLDPSINCRPRLTRQRIQTTE